MNRKHCLTGTPIYQTWSSMRQRCLNPKHRYYHHYGGRGIKICSQWDDFLVFLDDMGERPKGGTLERRNNSVGYQPDNCYWASMTQQNRNRRNSRSITIGNETKSLADWAIKYSIRYDTIWRRIKSGMDPVTAVTKPLRKCINSMNSP